jgi:hypothetical protein
MSGTLEVGASVRETSTGYYWCVTDLFDRAGVPHVGLLAVSGKRVVLTRDEYGRRFDDYRPAAPAKPLALPENF